MDSITLVTLALFLWAFHYVKSLAAERSARHRRRARQIQRLQRRPRRQRRIWVRQWLERRPLYGHHENLLRELHREDPRGFRNYMRISPDLFEEMVERLTPKLKKQDVLRHALPVGLKLAVTLRFMGSGCSFKELHYSFRCSPSAITKFVPDVLQAIIDVYMPEVLKCPKTPEEWKRVAEGFANRWNYHNCCGAIDGKHVAIKKPANAGSEYFNYKKFHSIILLGVCDASYKFLYVDIGAAGGAGDSGTWSRTTFHRALQSNKAGFPPPATLPGDDRDIPFHLVGDDAFAMKTWLMKPYSHRTQERTERIFSYRLSRARRVIENAFGLLVAVFRVFSTTINLQPETVNQLTLCGVVLHNLLQIRNPVHRNNRLLDRENAQYQRIQGTWREHRAELQGLAARYTGNNPLLVAKHQRDYLAQYYVSPVGAVPWQERVVIENPTWW